MNPGKMSPREQLLALVVAVVVVLTLYGLFRLKPALAEMDELRGQIAELDKRIKATTIPDPPAKSADALRLEMQTIEKEIPQLREDSKSLLSRLAPTDSQELQILISDLARRNQLQIRERLPYDPAKAAANPIISRADLQASKLARKKAQRESSKALRLGKPVPEQKKASTDKPKKNDEPIRLAFDDIKNPPPGSLHDLPALIASATSDKRPLQRLVIEGDFRGLQRFIAELEQLPWAVSVVKLDVASIGKEPPPGLPQQLSAILVLVL